MACNCGKGALHSDIDTGTANMLAARLRDVLGDNQVVEPLTVVCVEDDAWVDIRSDFDPPISGHALTHQVSKIVLTFHDVSDVQWVTDRLTRNPRP